MLILTHEFLHLQKLLVSYCATSQFHLQKYCDSKISNKTVASDKNKVHVVLMFSKIADKAYLRKIMVILENYY